MSRVRSYHGWRSHGPDGFRLRVRTHGLSLSQPELDTLLERLDASLDRGARRISNIDITLSDINGPRGGEDKRCRLWIKLERRSTVAVSCTGLTIWEALSQALSAAQRRCHEHVGSRRRRQVRRFRSVALA